MKKPHLITAGLLALAAIAAAQATTAAQSFIRVLEVAGEVQVAAKDRTLVDSVTWVGELASDTNAPQEAVWICPQGFKAKLVFVQSMGYNSTRLMLRRGNTAVGIGFANYLNEAFWGYGSGNLGYPILEEGDELLWQMPVESNPKSVNWWISLELVEV